MAKEKKEISEVEIIVRKHFGKQNTSGMGFLETEILSCTNELNEKFNPEKQKLDFYKKLFNKLKFISEYNDATNSHIKNYKKEVEENIAKLTKKLFPAPKPKRI